MCHTEGSHVHVYTCVGGQSHSRLQQLVSWCGGEAFDGCLVFDECHKAKNFIPGKEQRSTKVALAVSMVQKMLPQARVVYCSATGVSDVKNMVMFHIYMYVYTEMYMQVYICLRLANIDLVHVHNESPWKVHNISILCLHKYT